MTLDESIELWQKEHEHEIVYACNMDSEVHEIVERVNPWHTGTPTDDGDYLFAIRDSYWGVRYSADKIKDGEFYYGNVHGQIIAYQKIEPYKEKENGHTD